MQFFSLLISKLSYSSPPSLQSSRFLSKKIDCCALFTSHDVLSNPVLSSSIPGIKYFPLYSLFSFHLFRLSQLSCFTSIITQYNFVVFPFLVSRRDLVPYSPFFFPLKKNFPQTFFLLFSSSFIAAFLIFSPQYSNSFLLNFNLPRSASVSLISLV